MELWGMWTALIESCIKLASVQVGVSEAAAIIIFTLLARLMLMPISFLSAYKMYRNKTVVNGLKPELEQLREKYKGDQGKLARESMALYKRKGVKFLDRTTMLNMGSRGVLGLGLFQVLRDIGFSSKFLWIANLAKPDALLAILVGALTLLSMTMMPGGPEQSSLLLFAIPAIVSMFVLISFPSAIAIYWATSNVFTMAQTLMLRYVIWKRYSPAPRT